MQELQAEGNPPFNATKIDTLAVTVASNSLPRHLLQAKPNMPVPCQQVIKRQAPSAITRLLACYSNMACF